MNVTKGAERMQTRTIEESDGLRLKLTLSSLEQSVSQYYLKHTKHRERSCLVVCQERRIRLGV